MSGPLLNTNATLLCPHGGTVNIVPAGQHPSAGGGMLVNIADQFLIAGCPFQIPATPPIPSPCVTVRWIVSEPRSLVDGQPALSVSSVGMCLSAAQAPQGPVTIASPGQVKVVST